METKVLHGRAVLLFGLVGWLCSRLDTLLCYTFFMAFLDRWLDGIPMYKLVVGILFAYAVFAFSLSLFGLLPFAPLALFTNFFVCVSVGLVSWMVIRLFVAPYALLESSLISSLILFFILVPSLALQDLLTLVIASLLTHFSKVIIAFRDRHIFNPVAIGVVLYGLLYDGAYWWIGTPLMLPVVLIGGLLLVHKVRRFDVMLTFLAIYSVTAFSYWTMKEYAVPSVAGMLFLSGPVIFFATVMLTEPFTSSGRKPERIFIAAIIATLSALPFAFWKFEASPALALVVGNLLAYMFSTQERIVLVLKDKVELARNLFELSFSSNRKLNHTEGQYMEWSLPHSNHDIRGERRYFTVASAAKDDTIRLGVRVEESGGSTFKSELMKLVPGDQMYGAMQGGDFVLPDPRQMKKLLFIAGGIGITPFVSMMRGMIKRNEVRDVVILYAVRDAQSVAYRQLILDAKLVGVSVVYASSSKQDFLEGDQLVGELSADVISEVVPDLKEREVYLSGSYPFTEAMKNALRSLGVRPSRVHTDYFPGLA